jgi:hypothetical protein
MRDDWMNMNAGLVVLGVLVLASGTPAQAQTIPAKPGLWAASTVVTINGKQMPTRFDFKGALTEQQKSAIRQAMAQLGLPKNGNPSLICSTATEVDLQQMMADARSHGCVPTVTDRARDHISFNLACKTPQGLTAAGNGSATGINTDRVNYAYAMKGVADGTPVTYEARQVQQFVGPDCQHPPAGIDPQWIGM